LIRRRQTIKRKDARSLLDELSGKFGAIEAQRIEIAEFEEKKIVFLDERIAFVRDENGVYPYLGSSFTEKLPKVVVDMGAIRFVCNGADVMAPGITDMDDFAEGAVVVIRDVNHGKALAIGVANKSSAEITASKKGKVIRNLHYVGDKLWEAASA
jgi:PUA-domain protein